MIAFVDPTREGLEFIAKNLRKSDIEELSAVSFDVAQSVMAGASVPGVKRMVLVDGVPVFAAGLVPIGPGICQGWGFGTDGAKKAMKSITKEAKRILKALGKSEVSRVQAYCAGRSKWLKAIGLNEVADIGEMNGKPFVLQYGVLNA